MFANTSIVSHVCVCILLSGFWPDLVYVFSYPGNTGNLSLQHSPESWKYYPIPKPNPKPNPYPFLDPGRVIPGNAGGPGPGRRAGSQNPNPLGGCAPQTPARVSSGRSGVQRHICLSSYFIIPHPASYFINLVNPVGYLYVRKLNLGSS